MQNTIYKVPHQEAHILYIWEGSRLRSKMQFIQFETYGLAVWFSSGLFCQFVVKFVTERMFCLCLYWATTLSMKNSWLLAGRLLTACYTVLTSPKKDETAVCGCNYWLAIDMSSYFYRFIDKLSFNVAHQPFIDYSCLRKMIYLGSVLLYSNTT